MAPQTELPTTENPTRHDCATCAHSWEGHDAVARRYCDATRARGLDRGCLCAA